MLAKKIVVVGAQPRLKGWNTQYGVSALEALGVNVELLSAKLGLLYPTLTDQYATVDASKWSALWSDAIALDPEQDLGLRAAAALPWVARDPISHLQLSSATLGEALRRSTAVLACLERPNPGLVLRPHGDKVILEVVPGCCDHPEWTAFRLAWQWKTIRSIPDGEVVLVGVSTGGSGGCVENYRGCFGDVPIEFGAARPALHLHLDSLTAPISSTCEEVAAAIEDYFHQHTDDNQLEDDRFVERTLDEVRQGYMSEDIVATRMGVSERTLRRRLAAAGTSYRRLVESARQAQARMMLEADRPLPEIARALGYTHVASLGRALRRWTGANAAVHRFMYQIRPERVAPEGDAGSRSP